jgi:hypothetical protein
LKISVSVVCLLLIRLSFSNFSFNLYICIISCSVDDFHSIKLIRLSQHEIASATVILFSSSTDPLLSSLSSLSFNLWPTTASITSEFVNVWETSYIIYIYVNIYSYRIYIRSNTIYICTIAI